MSSAQWVFVATAVLAVVAITAAVVAVRAARRVAASPLASPHVSPEVSPDTPSTTIALVERREGAAPVVRPEPYLVDGRLFVPPSQQQVVAAALGRPHVRLSLALHGLTHALRPESRDRIAAMMRREYRRRRRLRLRAARRAVREASPGRLPEAADSWIGDQSRGREAGE